MMLKNVKMPMTAGGGTSSRRSLKSALKRGFTIMELVIVIAVIAVLAAVLIPTFANITERANESNDTQLVRNLNTALLVDGESHETMQDALEAVRESGYDVAKINASATNSEILWDSANDVFCYKNGDEIKYIPESSLAVANPEPYQFWQISDSVSDTYSTYLYNYTGNGVIENLTTGLDVGEETGITEITYDRSTATDAREVTIRTNGGELNINAANDVVNHYGAASIVDITAIDTESFHEFGNVSWFRIVTGHVVLESDSNVLSMCIQAVNNEVKANITKHENAFVKDYKTFQGDKKASSVLVNGETVVITDLPISQAAFGKDNEIVLTGGVAETSGVQFLKLSEACRNATAGGTVKLLQDIYLTSVLQVQKELTIDLNGYGIYSNIESGIASGDITNSDINKSAMILVSSKDGNLTVVDSSPDKTGVIDIQEGNEGFAITVHGNEQTGGGRAKLTIEAGTIIGNMHSVFVGYGELIVNGGTFRIYTDDSSEYVSINCEDTRFAARTATVSITGGRFYKFDPTKSAEAGNPSFVAEGYEVLPEDSDGYFEVVKSN